MKPEAFPIAFSLRHGRRSSNGRASFASPPRLYLRQLCSEVGSDGSLDSRRALWSRISSGFSTVRTISCSSTYSLADSLAQHKLPDTVETLATRTDQCASIRPLLSLYRRTKHLLRSNLVRNSVWLTRDNGFICRFAETETVSECFDKVSEQLSSASATGLRICALSSSTDGIQAVYSFPYGVYLTLSGKVTDATRLFYLLMGCLLMSFWSDDEQEKKIIEALVTKLVPRNLNWQPVLPSRFKNVVTKPRTPLEVVQWPPQIREIDWRDVIYLEFQWTAHLPQYASDVDVYVWEPYKQWLACNYVRLLALKPTSAEERRLVAIASSSGLLNRLGNLEATSPDRNRTPMLSIDVQLLRFVTIIQRIICEDVTQFITQASARIDDVVSPFEQPLSPKHELTAVEHAKQKQCFRCQDPTPTALTGEPLPRRSEVRRECPNP